MSKEEAINKIHKLIKTVDNCSEYEDSLSEAFDVVIRNLYKNEKEKEKEYQHQYYLKVTKQKRKSFKSRRKR